MSPQDIVNESHQKTEVNLEDVPTLLDRRENVTVVSDIMKSERVPNLLIYYPPKKT